VASATIVPVTVAHTPVRRLLIPAAVGVVALGVAGLLVWLASGFAVAHGSTASPGQQVQATVVKSAPCAGSAANDLVNVPIGGRTQQLKLDGCGNQVGQKLAVLLPTPLPTNGIVEPASVAPSTATSGSSQRLAFVLLLVSTLVGGACGYWLHRNRGGLALGQMLAARPADTATAAPSAAQTSSGRSSSARSSSARLDSAPAPLGVPPESPPELTGPNTGTNWFEDSGTDLGFDFSKLDEEMSQLTESAEWRSEEWNRED
jgi:hypothetical protein